MVNKSDHTLATKKQFVRAVKGNTPLAALGKFSDELVLLDLGCGRHYGMKTLYGANKDEREMICHICCRTRGRTAAQVASIYVVEASWAIAEVFTVATVVTEARVLKKFNGAMDFTICWSLKQGKEEKPCCLHVEVDGEQHFVKGYKKTTAKQQLQVDMRKDKLVLDHRLNLLRLHHKDKDCWVDDLRKAKELVESSQFKSFVEYTESYEKKLKYRKK